MLTQEDVVGCQWSVVSVGEDDADTDHRPLTTDHFRAILPPAMRFVEKACVMDAARINRALSRLASEIVEHNRGVEGLLLVGVRRRGVPLAERIAERIAELEGAAPALAAIDVAFYGDDLSLVAPKPVVRESTLPEDLAQPLRKRGLQAFAVASLLEKCVADG